MAEPLLAESDPEVSEDGCTVTVTIKEGVKFSPPVDRAVTSTDVKYAIERGFFNSVNNGYAGAYFGDLAGPRWARTRHRDPRHRDARRQDRGLQPQAARGRQVHRRRLGRRARDAARAPVPKEYAAKFDAKATTTYGENQVSTGPYMIENDASGKAIGYEAGPHPPGAQPELAGGR